jgi:hypothetical protein
MEQVEHIEKCCPACAEKITLTHENIAKIAEALNAIDLSAIENSMVGKMLGLGKK